MERTPVIVVLTLLAAVCALYAFICQIREDRVARAAVRRLRSTDPARWNRLHWVYRRLANPGIAVRLMRQRDGPGDPEFERTLAVLKGLERRRLIALGAALALVGLMLAGTWIWDWSWDAGAD